MKIIIYCQHVLGIGHFFRSLEICKALKDHDVFLVSGGTHVAAHVPDNVKEVRLPELMMDVNFKRFYTTLKDRSIDEIKSDRQIILLDLFKNQRPDCFLVELYPFGRKAFRFELDPVLARIRNQDTHKCSVVCSLRDILVEKENTVTYEQRVVYSLNRYFDALLIHSDPNVIRLDETFSRMDDIAIPHIYTGFVTAKPPADIRSKFRSKLGIKNNEILIVTSAGGGKIGAHLLQAVLAAGEYMKPQRLLNIYCFAGPYMSEAEFERLQKVAGKSKRVQLSRFTNNFLSYIGAADLSVSMAGYNTCMNLLATQVPSLVLPFTRNREQRMRAERLSRLAAINVLEDQDLNPVRLAGIMTKILSDEKKPQSPIDLNGAAYTAQWIDAWHRRSA